MRPHNSHHNYGVGLPEAAPAHPCARGIRASCSSKNAQDTKSGAGQYFTPRPLIQAIVDVMAPKPGETVSDPACGTGGFLLAAHDYVVRHNPNLTKPQKTKLKEETFKGWELVQATARLCAMNMLLHGIGSQDFEPIVVADSLAADPGDRFDLVLTNPPFGKKSSTTIVGEVAPAIHGSRDISAPVHVRSKVSKERDIVERGDFWTTTSNKQLNFVQHVKTLLKQSGRAAVVVPDNVLFEGGAGETIRRKLLHECDVHTLLRLPTGLFYAQGVKANVLFFDKKPASETPWTKKLWIYDLRTNIHFTLKTDPLKREDLDEFVKCYNPENRHQRKATWSDKNDPHPNPPPDQGEGKKKKGSTSVKSDTVHPLTSSGRTGLEGRWRAYTYDEISARDKVSLDIFWLRDDTLEDSNNLPAPDILAAEIVADLEAALEQFREIATDLGQQPTKG